MTLTVGSLFSGIGGLELGLERAGMIVRWQVEKDPYAQRVLAKHWPHVARFDDVRTIGGHNLPRVDVICGGFPCQDISVAGKGAGLAGERSGLWVEFARIIRELRPRYVLVENVAALLARGLGDVLGDLAACGFDAEWDCIPAAAVGAPHRRDRLFVVAYAQCQLVRQQPVAEPRREGAAESARQPGGSHPLVGGRAVADANRERLEEFHPAALASRAGLLGREPPADWGAWATEPDVGRVAHGFPPEWTDCAVSETP